MTVQLGKDVFGVAKQSAKGSLAAQPTFAHGLASGTLKPDITQETDPLTSGYLSPASAFRDRVESGGDLTTRAFVKSIGLYLYGVLGDIDSTEGSPAVKAVLTTALTGVNNDLTFLAQTAGTAGNGITITLLNPSSNDHVMHVEVASLTITVHLGTGPTGAITSTAEQVAVAVNAKTEAAALVHASIAPGNSGAGVVTALTATNLAGGAAAEGSGYDTHVITLGSALSYLSCYQKKGDTAGTIVAVQDCKVDELTLSWEENKPVELKYVVKGTVFSFPSTFTPGTDETASVDYFRPVGGTFKLDVDSPTPVTAPIRGGSISIKRSVETTAYSGSIEPADSDEGTCDVEVSFTIRPADLTDWRAIATGTPAGTTIAGDPVYGSFEHTFVSGAASLKLEGLKVAYLADLPDADPAGGAADVPLAGICYRVDGTPITCTLINTQVSY